MDKIKGILENAVVEFNAWSHCSAVMNVRLRSEVYDFEYYEAEGRRMQARVMLEDIARAVNIEVKYRGRHGTTTCDGEEAPIYWREAYIEWKEV